ncbi:MAG: glycosyltransferase family 4 protein [Lachnospiraceae bacterium]|nr:glycosyltransferase family 4 protein [Lachnospiraceae bacterium]
MKSICFFSGDITKSGGTEKVASVIANGLARMGKYRILFLSLVEQKSDPFFFILPKIERFVLKSDKCWVSPGPAYLPFVPRLRKFLKEQKIDIIIDIDIVLDILSIPAATGLSVKVVSWEHFSYYFEQKFLYRRIIARFSARFSDYMVTLTKHDKQNYQKLLHRKERIIAIYNPVEIPEDLSDIAPREKILITIGHLIPGKGIDMLAKIIPEILGKHRDWKWYFLGDGELRALLEDVQKRHGLRKQLILTGTVKNVNDYLQRASILVMASREEGLGMCFLEAKAARVPSVAFDVPIGPRKLISHGVNGFLIPAFNLKDMTDKILMLMKDDVLREQFSYNTTIDIEQFRLEPILEKWVRLIDMLFVHEETVI